MKRGGRTRGRGKYPPGRQRPPIKPFVPEQIQNINLELELLKQKREMIEHQRLMLESQITHDQQRQYGSKPPRYYEQTPFESPGPSRPGRNYPYIYEDSLSTGDYIPLNTRRKRPAEVVWEPVSNPKRWAGSDGGVVHSFGSRLGPKPSPQTPKRAPVSQKKPHPSKSKFNPPTRPPNKKAVNTPARTKLPSKNVANENEDSMKLRADSEPSSKVRGRLEFTLGFIFKQMKAHFAETGKFTDVLNHNPHMNNLKSVIRERLKSVMVNKVVGRTEDVVSIYRKRYSIQSDAALLKTIRKDVLGKTSNANVLSDEVIAVPMNPKNYLNTEMRRVMDAELDEMFRKLQIIYNPNIKEANKAAKLAMESVDAALVVDSEDVPEEEKNSEEIKLWKKQVHEMIRKLLPKIMIKNAPLITKLLRLELVYINTCTSMLAKSKEKDESVHKLEVGLNEEYAFAPRYTVRVHGHPKLPPANVIRPFLAQFKPVSVKKCKMTRNVIYAIFSDLKSMERMIKQNGIDFGQCFLKITGRHNKNPSEKMIKKAVAKAQKKKRAANVKNSAKNKSSNDTGDKVIPSDLDNKIDDLLSSIRKGEEELAADSESIVKPEPEENTKKEDIVEALQNENNEINVPTEASNDNNFPTEGSNDNNVPTEGSNDNNVPTEGSNECTDQHSEENTAAGEQCDDNVQTDGAEDNSVGTENVKEDPSIEAKEETQQINEKVENDVTEVVKTDAKE